MLQNLRFLSVKAPATVIPESAADYVLAGDLMKSMALLLYKAEEAQLELRARDYSSNWMTAVEMLDDDVYLGAENSYNIMTVRKNNDDALDDNRTRLEVCLFPGRQLGLGQNWHHFESWLFCCCCCFSSNPLVSLLFCKQRGRQALVCTCCRSSWAWSTLASLQHAMSV